MNKIKVGSKVVDRYLGDMGIVTGVNDQPDPEDVKGETAWWVRWETGTCKGNEFWMVESDLILFDEYDIEDYPDHRYYQEENVF